MNILTVHFNTPELTSALIKSINIFTQDAKIFVFDNSDQRPLFDEDKAKVTYFDNTKGQLIDFEKWLSQFPYRDASGNNFGSAKHTKSIDYCFELIPDGFILLDSDILLTKDISIYWDQDYACSGEIRTTGKHRIGIPRLLPFICYINVPMCKQHNIRYCNPQYTWMLTKKDPDRFYDTGAWLIEDIRRNKLPIKTLLKNDYSVHYGKASWKNGQKDPQIWWLNKYKYLWDDVNKDVKIYICTHTDFACPVKSPVYEIVDARRINNDHYNGLHGSFYSELMTYKWLADNKELPPYVGFCHYRKYFSFLDCIPDIPDVIRKYGCITTKVSEFDECVYDQYKRWHNYMDMDIAKEIVREYYPEMHQPLEKMLQGKHLYTCNMYILKREHFLELINFVWGVLDKVVEIVGTDIESRLRQYQDIYLARKGRTGTIATQYRIGGYLGERLASAWIMRKFPIHKEYEMTITEKAKPHNYG
jgi:hypothetical protein